MVTKICPRCQMRFICESNEEDFIHNCGEQGGVSEVLRNEDVKIIGDWEDFTGTGTVQQPNLQGITNNIWGTRGALEGEKVSDKTSRGNDTDTHRTRRHEEFIDLKGGRK